jgi:glycosyltransferase involved in cell wall biosynthesis
MLGEGTLLNSIKTKVERLGISGKVCFAGVRSDVEKFYSAMDMMLMPSLFEGLPFVAIEAQCAGLKTLLSTNVTNEAIVSDICKSRSLNDSIEKWCSDIEDIKKNKVQRSAYSDVVKEKKYDINYTADRLLEIYSN